MNKQQEQMWLKIKNLTKGQKDVKQPTSESEELQVCTQAQYEMNNGKLLAESKSIYIEYIRSSLNIDVI